MFVITSKTNAEATKILSAIGSNISPNLDSSLNILANNPSKKSVNDAAINKKKGIKSPKNQGRKKVPTNIGTIIILPIVRIFGILNIIFVIHEKNHVFSLQLFPQFLELT